MADVTTAPPVADRLTIRHSGVDAERSRRAAAWVCALLLSVYLGLSGGGYDIIVRSEIGLIVWWFLLLGALIGLLPRSRVPRAGWIAVSLLGGFLIWTWIGVRWSSSRELTLDEVCRLSTYLGVFLLALCALSLQGARALVNGLGCGIAVVSGIAVLSKLTPALFPPDTARSFYATARLSYPFDYADGVGEYAALGLPLVLYIATSARTLAGRSLAAAAILPVLLCLAMTVSRGGLLAAAVGTVALLALIPNRIPRLPVLALAAAGIAVLMVALLHRPALRDSVAAAPAGQRHSMLILIVIVMAATAVVQALLQFAMRRTSRPGWLFVSRRSAQAISAAILVLVVAVIIGVIVGGTASRLWHDFKLWEPAQGHTNQYFRLLSLAGSHRYQYWQVAWQAFSSSPLHGIGSGTFRFYWERHTTHAEYILNAHSLWFETLAETGLVGGVLLVGFFVLVGVGGAVRALRAPGDRGALIAAATAGVLSFCAAASFDWVWQIGVVPMVALLLAAVTLVPESLPLPLRLSGVRPAWPRRMRAATLRVTLVAASILGAALILIPLASTVAVRSSQAAAADGHLSRALADANTAQAIEPSAASPYLQRALVYEQANDIPAASRQIAAAIRHEPDNYTLWMAASRIATEADQPVRALRDYRRAKLLYPTSTLFLG